MKKIGIFADIHSNYLVFKKAIEDAVSRNIDLFLFLGDYITDGLNTDEILNTIRSLNMYAINGNRELSIIGYDNEKDEDWLKYDQYKSMLYTYENISKENLDFIKKLDIYKIVEIEGKKVCISHSSPYNVRGNIQEDSYQMFDKIIKDYPADIYLFGHEHKSYFTYYKDKYFINPGSVGLPTDGENYSYGLLEIGEKIKYQRIDFDFDYEELEKHYKNSEYYKKATIWCEVLLRMMKEKYNYPIYLIDKIKEIAKKENIDISKNIPNELFRKCYEEFIENKEIKIKGD
jgi:putative phosphoesterase